MGTSLGLRRTLSVVVAAGALAGAIAAAEPPQPREEPGKPAFFQKKAESEREAKIRRAREEIRKNPQQKKFILFRYGLKEEDL